MSFLCLAQIAVLSTVIRSEDVSKNVEMLNLSMANFHSLFWTPALSNCKKRRPHGKTAFRSVDTETFYELIQSKRVCETVLGN